MNFLLPLCFGVGLSAASGFRVFVPPLILSIVAQQGNIDLPAGLAWLDSPLATMVLGVATAIEILAYYIPVVDNAVNAIETPLAAISGTLLTAAFLGDLDPALQWSIAAIAGGGTASVIEGVMGTTRLASTGMTGGLANPIVSTIELLCSAVLSLLALLLPILALVLVVGLVLFALRQLSRVVAAARNRRNSPPSAKP
ncbi:MAG: DUF4126 domain-containing protein [Cyanobacteria bacterium J06641_5]